MKKYFFCILAFLIAGTIFAQTYIVLDATHGGKDIGAKGYCNKNGKEICLQEKDIALKIVHKLETLLNEGTKDAKIFLTRHKDVFCSKEERTEKLCNIECGTRVIYVSIGVNSDPDTSKNGFIVYIPSIGRSQFKLANALSIGLNDAIGSKMEDLGLQYKTVTDMYSANINVDIGFLSNAKDAKLLSNDDFIQKCANGLFEGIKTFMNYKQATKG